jgi:hypothetical protein
MEYLDLTFVAPKRLKTSTWAFDRPFLRPGEAATITQILAGSGGPGSLYLVRRFDGQEEAVPHSLLAGAGCFDLYGGSP